MPHIPVLLDEIVSWINPRPGGRYLDGTLGLGGHTRALLQHCRGEAEILGIDRDLQTLNQAQKSLQDISGKIIFAHTSFGLFENVLREIGWSQVDGALLDLGVSSMQIDQSERGFSFLQDGPLDMRMDPSSGAPPAKRLVNTCSVHELKNIISRLGEDPLAGRIARAIADARQIRTIETTLELADIVSKAYPAKMRATARNHPATRTFQALRMAVNKELEDLSDFLAAIPGRLTPGARVAVISFHSLEDRLVKQAFRRESKDCICPPRQPVCLCGHRRSLRVLTPRPLTPSDEEKERNPRSRSAKLRVAERLASQDGSIAWTLLLAVLALILGLATVWVNIERVDLAYKLRQLEQEYDKEADLHAKLEVERNNLLSPYRLEQMGRKIGLKPAEADDIRTLETNGSRP